MSAVVLYQAGTGITDHAAQQIGNYVRNNTAFHFQNTHAQH